MMSNIFVCQLSAEQRVLVETKTREVLRVLGYRGKHLEQTLELAMDSRICDLPFANEIKKELMN